MMSPNLTKAPNSERESVEIGYDVSAGYYTLTHTVEIIRKGELHIRADKKLVLTLAQAEKLRDDLNVFVRDRSAKGEI